MTKTFQARTLSTGNTLVILFLDGEATGREVHNTLTEADAALAKLRSDGFTKVEWKGW